MGNPVATHESAPWLRLYPAGLSATIDPQYLSVLDMLDVHVKRQPGAVALRYFDYSMTIEQLDRASTAFAALLRARRFGGGDRVALYLQNMPQYVVALLGTWKAGGVVVPINPMSRARELAHYLDDSGARVLVTLRSLHEEVAASVVPMTAVDTVFTTSGRDYQSENDPRVFPDDADAASAGSDDFRSALESFWDQSYLPAAAAEDDLAVICYTSGTTGGAKGAMISHANLAFNTQVYRDWLGLSSSDSILGIAPLFHVTGLVGHISISLLLGAPLILTFRFEPNVMLEAIRRFRPTFTIGAITAFTALRSLTASAEDYSSLKVVCSGGAPISPASLQGIREEMGLALLNMYGATETTSPTHCVPPGLQAPVDAGTRTLSVGIPVPSTAVRIVKANGEAASTGETGEILVSGPQVVRGYWGRPDASAEAFDRGFFHTGDVGFVDPDGWLYVVDRMKDVINASGFKVWPREVEDAIVGHPAVREVAVVGVPDPYRGETIKAFVALWPGGAATGDELKRHCRKRLSAYKCPTQIDFVDELPKTLSGKILRRVLREDGPAAHEVVRAMSRVDAE
jgi:long-chain acyl-CoA synthetase